VFILSGIDEQHVDVSRCPLCSGYVLTWKIYLASSDSSSGYFNCTDKFKGPDYYHLGSIDDILSFECCVCYEHIERRKPFFNVLLRTMLKAKKVE